MQFQLRSLDSPPPEGVGGKRYPLEAAAAFRHLLSRDRARFAIQGAGSRLTANRGGEMAICEVCGNDYDKAFQVVRNGEQHTFDSFECAIHALAPTCGHCGCRIIGHGVEADGSVYCCASCAREVGAEDLRDRV